MPDILMTDPAHVVPVTKQSSPQFHYRTIGRPSTHKNICFMQLQQNVMQVRKQATALKVSEAGNMS